MSKLHSFPDLIFFLICGQLACDTESATNQPGVSQNDAAVGVRADAAKAPNESGAGPEDAGVTQPDAGAQLGTFSHIYQNAFRTCRTSCHVMGFSMLNMATREAAYAALVDQDSNPRNMNCAPLGLKRVKPGAPEESLLYLKLDIQAPCGQQMPPGGQLPQEYRDEVRDWIANGAKDD